MTEHVLIVERFKRVVIRVEAESAEAALVRLRAEPTDLYEYVSDGDEVDDHLDVRLPDWADKKSWWWDEMGDQSDGTACGPDPHITPEAPT